MIGITSQPGMRSWETAAADIDPLTIAELRHWFDWSDPATLFSNSAGTILSNYGDDIKAIQSKVPGGDLITQSGTIATRTANVKNGLDAAIKSTTAWYNGGGSIALTGVVAVISPTIISDNSQAIARQGTSSNRIHFTETQGLFNPALANWPSSKAGVNVYAAVAGYSGSIKFWRNSVTPVSVTNATLSFTGLSRWGGGAIGSTLCEVFAFSAIPSETSVQQLITRCMNRWGVTPE